MNPISRSGRLFIFTGDVILLYVALFAALWIRYPRGTTPEIFYAHLFSFTFLFVIWCVVFVIAGLYNKHIRVQKNRLPSTILKVQVVNSLLALAFFYSIPYFGIAPKVTLFIYLVISFVLITLWRMYGPFLFGSKVESAIFIASGSEFKELVGELTLNKGYPLVVAATIDLSNQENIITELKKILSEHPEVTVIVADIDDTRIGQALSFIYELVKQKYICLGLHDVYEDVFERLPISLLDDRWLIQNISLFPSKIYDTLKRTIDVFVGAVLFIISLIFYPFVFFAIKLDDGGPLFFTHHRVGQYGKPVKIVKFRSMVAHEKITRVGKFLRKTRIDELPQLWNVIKGDLSLIGPRSEIMRLVEMYEKEIPYYSLRHMVKPGLSGWAQITQKDPPKFVAEVDATKQKVSYDLFYIKNRSFILDIIIALRTVRELVSRRGI